MKIGQLNRAVFDSNVFINLQLQRIQGDDAGHLLTLLVSGNVEISIVSQAELFSILLEAKAIEKLSQFVTLTKVHPFDESLLSRVIQIRQHYRLKLPDAIIAATALYLDLPLVTSDLRGFRQVPGLECIVPERRG